MHGIVLLPPINRRLRVSTLRLFSANHDNLNISSLVPISNISASSEKVLRHVSVDVVDRGAADDFDRDDADDVIMLHGCMGIVICVFATISPPFILLPSPCLIVILRALLHTPNLFAIFSPITGVDASQSIIAFTVIPAIWTRTVNKGS